MLSTPPFGPKLVSISDRKVIKSGGATSFGWQAIQNRVPTTFNVRFILKRTKNGPGGSTSTRRTQCRSQNFTGSNPEGAPPFVEVPKKLKN